MAEEKPEKYPFPSELFHSEKKRKDIISKMGEIKDPLFLLLYPHTNIENFSKAIEKEKKVAEISDNAFIFSKDLDKNIQTKLSELGIEKYRIFELPKGYQKNPDLFDETKVPSELQPKIQKSWSDIQKQGLPESQEGEEEEEEGDIIEEPSSKKEDINIIKNIKSPRLLIIDMGELPEHKAKTDKFLHSKKNEAILNKAHLWTYLLNRYAIFVCPAEAIKPISSLLNREVVDFALSKQSIPVLGEEPFTELAIDFAKLAAPDEPKIRELLNQIWAEKPSKEEEEEEEEESLVDSSDKRKGIPPEKFKKIFKMQKPWLLLIQTKTDGREFETFIKNKDVINFLARGVKYILTKKSAIRSWIIPQALASKAQELCKKFKVQYSLTEMPKGLNEKDQPFAEMKINLSTLGKINEMDLRNQLNENWQIAAHAIVRKPTLEMNSLVPLDYLRFMNPESKEVELYLGGHPVDVGTLGLAYVLLEAEEEGEHLKENLFKLRLPEKVYEDMDVVSYLPKGFTGQSPKKIMPANCLVLFAKETFAPTEKKSSDPQKRKDIYKKLFDEIKKIGADQIDDAAIDGLIQAKMKEYGKKAQDEFSGVGLAQVADPFDKTVDSIFKKYEEELYEFVHATKDETELDELHMAAKKHMNVDITNVGSFVNTNRFIGTHVAHFSRDFKICILWGTTAPISVKTEEMLKELDFVKTIDDTYA
jgi:hypothetical protein